MLDEMIQDLLKWFEKNGRKFFWRVHSDPYTVLMAEILLKKTTASAVDRFLPAFLSLYPNAEALTKATSDELRRLLLPLGLSAQRARQLAALGEVLMQRHNGQVPSDPDVLRGLPGVGEYTAAAVLSFAYSKPEALVDANVARVLVRLHGISPSRYEARRSPEVWDKARELVGREGKIGRAVNWAILDLGALVCKPGRPRCSECPLHVNCAHANVNAQTTT